MVCRKFYYGEEIKVSLEKAEECNFILSNKTTPTIDEAGYKLFERGFVENWHGIQ